MSFDDIVKKEWTPKRHDLVRIYVLGKDPSVTLTEKGKKIIENIQPTAQEIKDAMEFLYGEVKVFKSV